MLGLSLLLLALCLAAVHAYQDARRREGEPWYLIGWLPAWYHKMASRPRVCAFGLGSLLAMAFATALSAQAMRAVPRPIVVLTPAVADSLAARYARTQTSAEVPEHAECLTATATPMSGKATLFVVTGTRAARIVAHGRDASKVWIQPKCPRGTYLLHTHSQHHCTLLTGSTCTDANWWKYPSANDLNYARSKRHAMGLVQWGPRSFTEYAPDSLPEQPPNRPLAPDVFVTLLASGVMANQIGKFDVDTYHGPRPLVDAWSGYHLAGGYALESLGHSMRVPIRTRLAAVCGTAVAFEYTQGQADPMDMALGCGGALLSAGIRAGVSRWTT